MAVLVSTFLVYLLSYYNDNIIYFSIRKRSFCGVAHDLIIVGADFDDTMSACKAARDGLRVPALEKCMAIGTIMRFCGRLLRLGSGGLSSDMPAADIEMGRRACSERYE